jgi:DNA damage-binding protein 1
MSYLYAVNSQRPTATNFSLVCNFTSSIDRNLILVRGNYLEIHLLRDTGLIPVLDVPMFGRIKALECYRPYNSQQDVLFILIERKKFCILGYDNIKQEIITRSIGNVKDRIGRDAEMGQRGFMDPDGRMIGMMLYDGLIKVSSYIVSVIFYSL